MRAASVGALFAGCSQGGFIPPDLEVPGGINPCTIEDQTTIVSDDATSLTGFNAHDVMVRLDNAVLDARYDEEQSEGPVLAEHVLLRAERTADPVLYVDRLRTPAGVLGTRVDGTCLTGPLLRVPLSLRWSTTLEDGAVAWWQTTTEVEVTSLEDPNEIVLFLLVEMHDGDAVDPVLSAHVETLRRPGEQFYRLSLVARGSLAIGERLGIDVMFIPEVEDGDQENRAVMLRRGAWTLAP